MKTLRLALLWIMAWGILTTASGAIAATPLSVVKPIMACEQLGTLSFSDKLGEQVTVKSAEVLNTAKGNFCKVSATIAPSVGIEVALPQTQWTQRFLQVGCGGLCGNINLSLSNANGCLPAMQGEFAVAATDMGHSGSMMDASWAEDPQKRIDFAYRANHLTARFTKALIQAYYGQPQRYAYFMGCSDGGREALMEAQRYPDDFDGITAGASAAFFQFQNSFFHGWNVAANLRSDGTAILLKDRLPILHQAVLSHCPTLSGVNDGVLENPYACHFSKSWVKKCSENQSDKSHCLTGEEIAVAENLYQGAHDNAGKHFVVAGLPIGSELRWPLPDSAKGHSMAETMVIPALQSVLLPGGKQNIRSMSDFPLNEKNFQAVAALAPLYNAANTNLTRYMKRGGKLIMWHGLADDSVSPAFSIAYYRGVETTLGKPAVDKFIRLFLLPGVAHCGGGEGPDQIDLLTPLMAWTEQQIAPQKIMAGKSAAPSTRMPAESPQADASGSTIRNTPPISPAGKTPDSGNAAAEHFHGIQKKSSPLADSVPVLTAARPVFPYPYIARFTGKGSPADPENYVAIKSDAWSNLVTGKPASDFIGPDNQKEYEVQQGQLKTK